MTESTFQPRRINRRAMGILAGAAGTAVAASSIRVPGASDPTPSQPQEAPQQLPFSRDLNPYRHMRGLPPAVGKYMSETTAEVNKTGFATMLEEPPMPIPISHFVSPQADSEGKVTIRRYPSRSLPYADLGMERIEPQKLNPNGLSVLRISGEDYGAFSTVLKDNDGRIVGNVAPWYIVVKVMPLDPKGIVTGPVAVSPLTHEPLKPGMLPYVVSRNMFEPKLSGGPTSATTAPTPRPQGTLPASK